MAGSHMAPRAQSTKSRSKSNSSWKVWVLVLVLLIAVAALCFLLWQMFGSTLMSSLGIGDGGNAQADIAPGIFTQVGAEYSNGKNAAGNLSVTEGTQRPDTIPPEEDVILLDIAWTGKNEQSEPVYVTVSDPSFTDGDGLAVHHYNAGTAVWDLIGTYTIQNNSVTFLADSFSPFAFQVISSEPEPTATPEPTPEPTATPEPTPEPTPTPIMAVDYGTYPTVQTQAFTLASELEDDQVYALALVSGLPADATAAEGGGEADAEAQDDAEEEDDVSFSYVEAQDGTDAAQAPADGTDAAAPAPVASVLVNLDGTNMRTVDMPLIQAEDGTWCLGGPVTQGMLWTSNRDAYKDERRFSFGNNDAYLNLDDEDVNMLLNDNRTRTRFLLETAELADGSTLSTLTYRNGSRYYVNAMQMAAEVITDDAFPAGTVTTDENGQTTPQISDPVYLGGAAPAADQSLTREVLQFTFTDDQGQAKQLMAFKLNEEMAAPAGLITTLPSQITVPAISEETNLETLVIMDGDRPLMLGTDYTISARVYNNSTVVVCINFIGSYTGQIVRTYAGTLIRTNATPETTPTPSPSPTPYVSGEGSTGGGGGGGGGGGEETQSPPQQETSTSTDTQNVVPYDNSDGSDT